MSKEAGRELSDAKTIRALAHPVRLALLDALRAEGELTASQAAELLGDSPGNMSWHLQTLAKYGFVEETGTGKGRSRPWRLVKRTLRFRASGEGDPEAASAGAALETVLVERAVEQLDQWRRQRAAFPGWEDASFVNNFMTYLTPQELSQMSDDLLALFRRYDVRDDPAERPADAVPVRLFAWGHPLVDSIERDARSQDAPDGDQ